MDYWKPFPAEEYNSRCAFCPQRGVLWIWQRALLRGVTGVEGMIKTHDRKSVRWPVLWILFFFAAAFPIELWFQGVELVREKPMKLLLSILALVVLIGPPLILWKYPDQYTPMVETLLNAVLFALALWLGYDTAFSQGRKTANDRWLPQAASACHRLQTVSSSVASFRSLLAASCENATKQLPELESEQNKAIRTLFGSQCQHGALRLVDIENHLNDALVDWQRFIDHNCDGGECQKILDDLETHRKNLAAQPVAGCAIDSSRVDNGVPQVN